MANEETLELDDIQGHVLIGFGGGYHRLLGLRVQPSRLAEARAALTLWLHRVTRADAMRERRERRRMAAMAGSASSTDPSLKLALVFSAAGLSVFDAQDRPADAKFAAPAASLAADLRDEVDGQNVPVGWKVGHTEATTPHVLAIFASDVEEVVERGATELATSLSDAFDVIYRDSGVRIKDTRGNNREHFGFEDGISQPGPRGIDRTGAPITPRHYPGEHPLSARYAAPGKPLVWPGQYVFGYASQRPDGDGAGPVMQGGVNAAGLKNGALLVFRRLRQDVAGFQAAMAALATDITARGYAVDAQTMAAWCVGRWPDGTPLTLSPTAPLSSIANDPVLKNGFSFDAPIAAAGLMVDGVDRQFPGAPDDRPGLRCPFFAHIRKVNPRDSVTDLGGENLSVRTQILRRGVTYGPPWTGKEDNADRGLLFMAYMTSVQDQFMRLSQIWANSTNLPPPGHGIDPIIGAPLAGTRLLTRVKPGSLNPVRAALPGRWVHATGSGVFFAPGIEALHKIVAGPPVIV
jgi:Dyp-type peroxidase family